MELRFRRRPPSGLRTGISEPKSNRASVGAGVFGSVALMKVMSQHTAPDKESLRKKKHTEGGDNTQKNDKQQAGTYWLRHSWDFLAPSSAAEHQDRPESQWDKRSIKKQDT